MQLDISFHVNADIDQISFFGAFGSEECPEWVDSSDNDDFGLFVNGQNVAGVQPGTGGANLPVNIDHPDMTPMPGQNSTASSRRTPTRCCASTSRSMRARSTTRSQ